jgi:hypothetical protein
MKSDRLEKPCSTYRQITPQIHWRQISGQSNNIISTANRHHCNYEQNCTNPGRRCWTTRGYTAYQFLGMPSPPSTTKPRESERSDLSSHRQIIIQRPTLLLPPPQDYPPQGWQPHDTRLSWQATWRATWFGRRACV